LAHRLIGKSGGRPAAADVPPAAGFADHDVRLGSPASITVQQEIAPAREEAGKMIWPAIWKVTQKALCDGDWRPPLSWLDVTELLDGPSG
jgi:hypothetical protein